MTFWYKMTGTRLWWVPVYVKMPEHYGKWRELLSNCLKKDKNGGKVSLDKHC